MPDLLSALLLGGGVLFSEVQIMQVGNGSTSLWPLWVEQVSLEFVQRQSQLPTKKTDERCILKGSAGSF